jgi:hypothetical protein
MLTIVTFKMPLSTRPEAVPGSTTSSPMYKDSGNTTLDFQGVIFNVIMTKICKVLNYDTKAFMSRSGKNIFILMAADEEDLKAGAENQEHSM